jgi:hypothetical protein
MRLGADWEKVGIYIGIAVILLGTLKHSLLMYFKIHFTCFSEGLLCDQISSGSHLFHVDYFCAASASQSVE